MKLLIALAACAASVVAGAQTCTWTSYLMDSTSSAHWADAALAVGGGIVGVTDPQDPFGDMIGLKINADRSLAWSRRYMTTDPSVELHPVQAVPTPDGGMVIMGYRDTPNHHNVFLLSVDGTGAIQWARIYMNPGVDQKMARTEMTARAGGGFLLALSYYDGIHLLALDPSGMPMWNKRYAAGPGTGWTHHSHSVTENANGDILLTGIAGTRLWVISTDGSGTPHWSRHFDLNVNWTQPSRGIWAINGDVIVLVSHSRRLMRLTSAGTLLWAKTYSGLVQGTNEIGEFSSGDLMLISRGGTKISGRYTSDGTPAVLRQTSNTSGPQGLIGIRNDSLFLFKGEYVTTAPYGYTAYPTIIDSDVPDPIGCTLSNTSLPTPLVLTPVILVDTLTVSQPTLKTWPMSFLDPNAPVPLDVTSSLATGPARPGFPMQLSAMLLNSGSQNSGPITATLTFDPVISNYISASPPPTSVAGNVITWVLPLGVGSFGSTSIHVQLQIPANVGLIGTSITNSFTCTTANPETNTTNNEASVTQVITGAYDPNDKLVWPADVYDMTSDSILNYTIRFQNTGTDTAFTVVIRDTLPSEVSVGSFIEGPASHPYTLSMSAEGIVTWTFNNILLPDSNTNEPLSHGLVSFRIKPDEGLTPGTVITNAADIYFDFNPPIRTPDAVVVLTMPTAVPVLHADQLLIYPVPVEDLLTVELPDGFVPDHLRITAMDGREMWSEPLRSASGRVAFHVGELPQGFYLLAVQGLNGQLATARFVKH